MRFKGGATRELRLPFPKAAWALPKTKPEIVAEIDRISQAPDLHGELLKPAENPCRARSGADVTVPAGREEPSLTESEGSPKRLGIVDCAGGLFG